MRGQLIRAVEIQTGPQIRLDLELDLPADKYLFIATNRFTQNYCVDFMRF